MTSDSAADCERLVRDFLEAWRGREIAVLMAPFDEDSVYHNVPVAPIKGLAGIRQIFEGFLEAFEDARLEVVTLAAAPGLVIAERVDYFLMRTGTRIELPVTGVFVVQGGKIRRFSDYFDLADFERQSGLKL